MAVHPDETLVAKHPEAVAAIKKYGVQVSLVACGAWFIVLGILALLDNPDGWFDTVANVCAVVFGLSTLVTAILELAGFYLESNKGTARDGDADLAG